MRSRIRSPAGGSGTKKFSPVTFGDKLGAPNVQGEGKMIIRGPLSGKADTQPHRNKSRFAPQGSTSATLACLKELWSVAG